MPRNNGVASLQSSTLGHIAHLLRRLCRDEVITRKDVEYVLKHIKSHLPPQIQSLVCHALLHEKQKPIFPELLNDKYAYIVTHMNGQYIWINDNPKLLPWLPGLNGQHIRSLKLTGGNLQPMNDEDRDYYLVHKLRPLYNFMCTLQNLVSLQCSQLCNNYMLELLSINCPNLENVNVEMCTDIDDIGAFYLGGHFPTDDTYKQIRRGTQIESKSVCRKLKKVNLEYTLACTTSAAMLLHLCLELEELVVCPDVNMGDVFTLLHGANPDRYPDVKRRYALKSLRTNMELDENVLALMVQTCPKLEDITLRCNGVERKDRNLVANLLSLNLKSLYVMNCNTRSLLWYLEQKGKYLKELTVSHLVMAPASLTFTRTHLQHVIHYCPGLTHFSLMLNNGPIEPDVPYTHFGKELSYFTCLEYLRLEGTSVTPEDLAIFVVKNVKLEELRILIHSLEILDDKVLFDLLSSGALVNLVNLFLYRPMLTAAGLKRLLVGCPQLQMVGPLSSWAITKKDREELMKDIRTNNWDLNLDSPEINHMMII